FAAIVRDKAYKLLSPRINEMSDALRATATPAVPDGLSAECRKELAAELRRVAAQLEGDERWARE
ncbi:MAG: hypothetical protein GY851_15505, partial [bacterium]|nr:hypothetical protein [bacterium]